MKLQLCMSLLLLPLAGCGSGGERSREFNGDTALAYVQTQLAFGFRIPGTEAHRQTGDWIQTQLEARADTVDVQAWNHVAAKGETLPLRNFIGRFLPERPDRILFVAHWDSRPVAERSPNLGDQRRPIPGANDGASGVAVLLGVADALKKIPPSFGVDLLFVDGEDYGDHSAQQDVLLGSRYYAKTLGAGPKPLFAVVFDMVGDRDLQIYKEGNSVANAPEVVERVWTRAEALGYKRYFIPTVGHTVGDDHLPLLEAGIRAIDVIDFDYSRAWHTVDDGLDQVSAASLQVVGDVAVALTR